MGATGQDWWTWPGPGFSGEKLVCWLERRISKDGRSQCQSPMACWRSEIQPWKHTVSRVRFENVGSKKAFIFHCCALWSLAWGVNISWKWTLPTDVQRNSTTVTTANKLVMLWAFPHAIFGSGGFYDLRHAKWRKPTVRFSSSKLHSYITSSWQCRHSISRYPKKLHFRQLLRHSRALPDDNFFSRSAAGPSGIKRVWICPWRFTTASKCDDWWYGKYDACNVWYSLVMYIVPHTYQRTWCAYLA